MKNRETLNRIELESGRQAETENEIVLERLYAIAHDFSVGDEITVGGQAFTISGIGTTSDYDLCLQHPSDMSADGNVFGTAFVTEGAYQALLDGGKSLQTEEYRYSYRIKANGSETQLKDYLSELTSLLTFIPADDNPRIKASSDDVQINVNVGMMAGALINDFDFLCYFRIYRSLHRPGKHDYRRALCAWYEAEAAHAPLHPAPCCLMPAGRHFRYMHRQFPFYAGADGK